MSTTQSRAQHVRNRLGGLSRHGNPDPEQAAAARAELAELKIRAEVATWPPMTPEIRAKLAILLLRGGDDG
jgi:hypothetical protein